MGRIDRLFDGSNAHLLDPEQHTADKSALIRRWAATTKWLRRKQQIYKKAEANIGKWKWRAALVFVAPPYLLLVIFADALMWTGEHIEDAGYWLRGKLP